MRHRSLYCEGEKCFCGQQADHKIEEVIFDDDWSMQNPIAMMRGRHPLTSYICHEHFRMIMGPAADR